MAAGFVLTQAIRFGSSLVLTRLLAPDLYGLMTIGNVAVAALTMLSDLGLLQSIVQSHRGEDREFLDTVWTLKILRGAFLAAILGAAALLLAWLGPAVRVLLPATYGDPRLAIVLGTLALVPVADCFESTNTALCRRRVQLGPVVAIDVTAQVLSTLFVILAARTWPAAWTLPASWVGLALVKSVLSFAAPGPGNRLRWNRDIAREVWRFSRWIVVSSSLTFIYREGDRVLLGGMLPPALLGAYGVGTLLVGAVQQVVVNLSSFVGMPAMAEIARQRPQDLARAYRRVRLPIDLVCLSACALLFVDAHPIVSILYDRRYAEAGTVLRYLSLTLVALRFAVFDDFLVATGEPRQLLNRGLARAVALFVLVPAGWHLFGLPGALGGVVLAQLSAVPVSLVLKARRGLLDVRYELGVLLTLPVAGAFAWALALAWQP